MMINPQMVESVIEKMKPVLKEAFVENSLKTI